MSNINYERSSALVDNKQIVTYKLQLTDKTEYVTQLIPPNARTARILIDQFDKKIYLVPITNLLIITWRQVFACFINK